MNIRLNNRVLTIIMLIVFLAPVYIYAFTARADSIDSCQRDNAQRIVLADFLSDAVVAREASAKEAATPAEAKVDLDAAESYQENLDTLIESSKDVAAEPGSVEVNCEEAFPKPFPFNLIP